MASRPIRETSSSPSVMCFISCSNSQLSFCFQAILGLEPGGSRPVSDGSFDNLHVGFIHPCTVHGDLGEVAVELLKVRGPQRNVECSEVFGQVIDVAGAGDGNDERLA